MLAKVTIPLSCTVPMRGCFQSCQVTGAHPRRYVAQEDHLLPTSTVYDTLNLSAQLRLPRTMSKEDKARARPPIALLSSVRYLCRAPDARPTRCGTLWSCTLKPCVAECACGVDAEAVSAGQVPQHHGGNRGRGAVGNRRGRGGALGLPQNACNSCSSSDGFARSCSSSAASPAASASDFPLPSSSSAARRRAPGRRSRCGGDPEGQGWGCRVAPGIVGMPRADCDPGGRLTMAGPSVVFLDEPTSGLDSKIARDVCMILSQIAKQGCTIIASIHQPSSEVYQSLDQLLVLSEGKSVYQGPCTDAIEYFRRAPDP